MKIDDPEIPPLPPSANPDELILDAIAEAHDAAQIFARLAKRARREFRWRCELASSRIADALNDLFPGV